MAFVPKSHLPHLAREFYQGSAAGLWTHTLKDRAAGWLNDSFHHFFREILLHACHLYALSTPCYVLMPDHWHVVWRGLAQNSDQWLASAFLRKHLQPLLGSARLQDRAHDHVLRENERERGAFEKACAYVRQNPERTDLCADWRDWPHLGALISGYPDLDSRQNDFWEKFWTIHNRLLDGSSACEGRDTNLPALTRRATPDSSNFSGSLREERENASDRP
jgi:hypothetical protein